MLGKYNLACFYSLKQKYGDKFWENSPFTSWSELLGFSLTHNMSTD